MAIWTRTRRYTQKPAYPTVNWGHPLARGARVIVPFTENGQAIAAGGLNPPWRELVRSRFLNPIVGAGVVSQVQTQGGFGVNTANIDLILNIGTNSNIPIPTARATVLVIRRKTDSTARASSMFGCRSINTGTEIFNCHCPYSDGVVYWDFGGNTGANRI